MVACSEAHALSLALRAAPAHTGCLCRMDTAAKQLQQLNEEIAALSPEIKAAREAYNIKAAATTHVAVDLAGASSDKALQVLHDRAQTEERQALGFYEDLKKKEERLLGAREALHAKLPSAGERTLLLPCQQHQALRHLRSGLWVRLGIMQLCWKGKRQAAAQCQG